MNISRIFHTVKYLKTIQIKYQIWYRVRRKIRLVLNVKFPLSIERKGFPIKLNTPSPKYISFNEFEFTFLNLSKSFVETEIDWNFVEYGKLWTYNLNYFDFLLQPDMNEEIGFALIEDYISKLDNNSEGIESYPISLRGINWIKFISFKHLPQDFAASSARNLEDINNSLYAQYKILTINLEYHLLGNHLLENAFSLLFGAFYFKDEQFYGKASELLIQELKEQILEDGGHFELSPMYHQILLDRILDCVNLLQNNFIFKDQDKLFSLLKEKASIMLSWLNQMTFSNGDIPHFNDSTNMIAPSSAQLFNYAKELNLPIHNKQSKLSSSGYRRFESNNYVCIVDVGQVGPDYIPGHAHADMLSFVLFIDNKPFIIDNGISTYEKNNQRQIERSTSSHNTVEVESKNQSDVWSGFRVGKRARIKIFTDKEFLLEAEHNGYKPVIHKRTFDFNKGGFRINDDLSMQAKEATAYFHFHPDRRVTLLDNTVWLDDKYSIQFHTQTKISLEDYKYPLAYNKFSSAKRCKVTFNSTMQTEIRTYEN